MTQHVIALDQGTTSTRAIVFDARGAIVASAQREHEQIFPRAGWVEHDPTEIWARTRDVLETALSEAGIAAADVAAVGVTNQRETVVVWDRRTGEPVHNAIVWQDTRTQPAIDRIIAEHGVDAFAAQTGLPVASYFSASKVAWILDHVDGARARAEAGELLFGTPDAWVVWNLTGGAGWRHPCHGRDQRQPHPADGPAHARLGRRASGRLADSPGDVAGDSLLG